MLDPLSGQFRCANAGHNPPLWVQRSPAGTRIQRLTRTGMALGVELGVAMGETSIQMAPGRCAVLFYTDGVTEAFSPMGRVVRRRTADRAPGVLPSARAESLLDALESALFDFTAPRAAFG